MTQRQPAAAPASDLRSRIVERMPEILRLIRPNVEMGRGDVRPAIIAAIKQVEGFRMEAPSVARDKHARVEKLAKHLRWAIRGTCAQESRFIFLFIFFFVPLRL
jgi:hypothetical protein